MARSLASARDLSHFTHLGHILSLAASAALAPRRKSRVLDGPPLMPAPDWMAIQITVAKGVNGR